MSTENGKNGTKYEVQTSIDGDALEQKITSLVEKNKEAEKMITEALSTLEASKEDTKKAYDLVEKQEKILIKWDEENKILQLLNKGLVKIVVDSRIEKFMKKLDKYTSTNRQGAIVINWGSTKEIEKLFNKHQIDNAISYNKYGKNTIDLNKGALKSGVRNFISKMMASDEKIIKRDVDRKMAKLFFAPQVRVGRVVSEGVVQDVRVASGLSKRSKIKANEILKISRTSGKKAEEVIRDAVLQNTVKFSLNNLAQDVNQER